MPDMDELIAHEQARVLGGLKHRYPEDNYSPLELNNVDVLACARALAGDDIDLVLIQGPLELYPLGTIRVRLNNVISRL
jgi:hypothetical protein